MKPRKKRSYTLSFKKRLRLYVVGAVLIALISTISIIQMPKEIDDSIKPLYTATQLKKNLTADELKELNALKKDSKSFNRSEIIKELDEYAMSSTKVIDLSSSKINVLEHQLEKANGNKQIGIMLSGIGLSLGIVAIGEIVFRYNLFI